MVIISCLCAVELIEYRLLHIAGQISNPVKSCVTTNNSLIDKSITLEGFQDYPVILIHTHQRRVILNDHDRLGESYVYGIVCLCLF